MKPVTRYQSRLLFRKSYKPNRVIRLRPSRKVTIVFRPSRFVPEIQSCDGQNRLNPRVEENGEVD